MTFDHEADKLGFLKAPVRKNEDVNIWAMVTFVMIMGFAAAIAFLCIWVSLYRKRVSTNKQRNDEEIGPDGRSRVSIRNQRANTLKSEALLD